MVRSASTFDKKGVKSKPSVSLQSVVWIGGLLVEERFPIYPLQDPGVQIPSHKEAMQILPEDWAPGHRINTICCWVSTSQEAQNKSKQLKKSIQQQGLKQTWATQSLTSFNIFGRP